MKGEIFDIKRFAVHDGPGIRVTAFLKGCPLDCVWCHNPEGKRRGLELCHMPLQCIGCGACVSVCGQGALSVDSVDNGVVIERGRCIRCASCAGVCPSGALSARGQTLDSDELIAEFEKDEVFFKTSNGGITLSGGDPLFQPEFAAETLAKAKQKGWHTALETCLYAPAETVRSLIGVVDLWLTDLKIYDDKEHKRLTGCSNRRIFENYELLIKENCALHTRIPVIPGCTDSEENLLALKRYIAGVNPGAKAELMFYNPLGESKYRNYGLQYTLLEAEVYSAERKAELMRLMELME